MTTLTLLIEGSSSLTLSVSTGVTQADLALKVDKTTEINGYPLSGDIELATSDITESTDKKYVTNTEKEVLANTSGTNTGDQDLSAFIDNSTDTYTSEAKIEHVVSLTQAEYDAISTPDENTLYYIPI